MTFFTILRPWWLVMLIPSVFIWLRLRRFSDETLRWQNFIEPHLLRHLLTTPQSESRFKPIHLLGILWLLIIVALSGPSWRREPSPFAEDKGALVVVLKMTESMLNEDVQPTRLKRAKLKIDQLLEKLGGGSAALIVYSGSAHTVMPLTTDGRIISLMAEDIRPEIMPKEGDALNDALKLADSMLKTAGLRGSAVVLTDGISPAQLPTLAGFRKDTDMPVQLFATAWKAEAVPGIREAAEALKARITVMTVSDSDVQTIAGRATSDLRQIFDEKSGDRRKDGGVLFLPAIALIALCWSRKGWRVV